MPHFRRNRALERTLPIAFYEVCERLIAFDSQYALVCKEACKTPSDPRVQALHVTHEELLTAARRILIPERDDALTTESKQAFVAGVLALHHYSSTVFGGVASVDSVGSRTLEHFRTDWDSTVMDEASLRRRLERVFQLGEHWQAVDAALAEELDELRLRHRLIEALDRKISVHSSSGIFQLFDSLFVDHPFRVGDIGLVRTGTSFFFCIPYTNHVLDVPGYEERSVEHRQAVASFIDDLSVVRQEHFPVFGFFRGEHACRLLIQELADELEEDSEHIAATLTTMVSVLRSQDIDKYLVHDVWGHQWQAHLFPFEKQYQESGRFRRLPPLDEEVIGEDGWKGTLGATIEQAARWLGRDEQLDEGYWDAYLSAVFVERLMVSGVLSVAELLADVSEHKLHVLGGEGAEHLSSSSLFPLWPTKFDMILLDARTVFDTALEGFQRFAEADGGEGWLLRRVLVAYPELSADAAGAAIASLRTRVAERLRTEFHSRLECQVTDGALRVTPFMRLCLNLLGLHCALTDSYLRIGKLDIDYPSPLRDFRDLLLMSLGAFYQRSPQHNFWHLDEFTALCFDDYLVELCAALREP